MDELSVWTTFVNGLRTDIQLHVRKNRQPGPVELAVEAAEAYEGARAYTQLAQSSTPDTAAQLPRNRGWRRNTDMRGTVLETLRDPPPATRAISTPPQSGAASAGTSGTRLVATIFQQRGAVRDQGRPLAPTHRLLTMDPGLMPWRTIPSSSKRKGTGDTFRPVVCNKRQDETRTRREFLATAFRKISCALPAELPRSPAELSRRHCDAPCRSRAKRSTRTARASQ